MVESLTGIIESSKINKNFSELDSNKADLKMIEGLGTGLGGSMDNLAQLQASYPNGAPGFFITKDNNHYYIWKNNSWADMGLFQEAQIAKDSVDLEKTKFSVITSKNIFNKETAKFGALNSTGAVVSNNEFYTSEYIDVVPGQEIKSSNNIQSYGCFRKDNSVVEVKLSVAVRQFTIPPNTYKIKVTFYYTNLNAFMLAVGSLPATYEPFKRIVDPNAIGAIEGSSIVEKTVTKKQVDFFVAGKNKADTENLIVGKYYDPDTGGFKDNTEYNVFYRIPCKDYLKMTATSVRFLAFHDENGNNLPALGVKEPLNPSPYTFDIPVEAHFVSVTYKSLYSKFQLELGDRATDYSPNGVTIKDLQLPKSAIFDDGQTSDDLLLNLPSKIYATVGKELKIQSRNLLKEKTDDYNLSYDSAVGQTVPDGYKFTPLASGNFALSFTALKSDLMLAKKTTTIVSSVPRTSPIIVNVMGDSTVRANGAGEVTKELLAQLGSYLTLIGTMGSGLNRWEGRGGWTAATYRTDAMYEGVVNPYYNPVTKDFDFSYYMMNNGYSKVDVVVINLGINDTFSPKNKNQLDVAIALAKTNFDYIIASIKAYKSTIKVIVNLTIPPTDKLDRFYDSYGFGTDKQTQWRYKYNNFAWVNEMISYYDSKVILVPIHVVIDTNSDISDGVHPVVIGYQKIGLQLASCLHSLAVV